MLHKFICTIILIQSYYEVVLGIDNIGRRVYTLNILGQ